MCRKQASSRGSGGIWRNEGQCANSGAFATGSCMAPGTEMSQSLASWPGSGQLLCKRKLDVGGWW